MASVSKHVRNTVVSLLSDGAVGFNPTLATIAVAYSIQPFTLDFTSGSKTFLQGWYAAKDLIETTTMKLPLACLYTIKSQNQNTTKFVTFSGAIMMGLDVYISFPAAQAKNTTDDLVDAVEATLYTVFNAADNQSYYGDVQYNGDLLIKRGPIVMAGQNWMQLVSSNLSFDLIAA